LGRHLQHVLERGVADNLQAARRMIPVGSTEERKLTEAIQQARTLLQPFRASLQEAAAGEEQGEVRALLEDLARRQTELEKKLDKSSPTQQLD
jgi:nitrate/nitrite-specific signal transduction histidine kinase